MILAHAFTPDVWKRLRTASAESVSFDGTRVLYRVEHGVGKGPSAEEWCCVDGRGAMRLRIPKDFTPSGFTHDGRLYGTARGGRHAAVDCGAAAVEERRSRSPIFRRESAT